MRFSNEYGFYELNPFPGCNQVVVSNHAFIYEQYRGIGHGKQQHLERLNKAKELGYSYIICTVKRHNASEQAILRKNNWKPLARFWNIETTNEIDVWGKEL